MNDDRRGRRPAAVGTADIAALFDAVSDETRLALLRLVMSEEHCVSQCTEHIGLTHSAISKQLNALAAVGLLTRRPAHARSAASPPGLRSGARTCEGHHTLLTVSAQAEKRPPDAKT